MPYITERWPGGMLTNFVTIRKAVKKMASIDRMKKDGTFNTLSKKERLQVDRLRAKLEKNLGSIADMTRLPGALFVVDTMREHIAVKEAQKLNIPIFAMVDTNSDPRDVDYLIPANDDASKSINIIMSEVTDAIAEGLADRKSEKQADKEGNDEPKKVKKESKKVESAPKSEADDNNDSSDDLTKVEGIGPKAAEALVKAGIASYSDLAKADPENVKEILTEASSRMAHLDPTSWPKQAQMAADGKWDELKEWQDSVKGGVEE